MKIDSIRIDEIEIKQRHRKDYGDIEALAKSIDELGLLQPIGITSENELVFGERRIKAFQHLGKTEIPARTVDIDAIVFGEYAENELRKDFTPSERVSIGEAIERVLGNRAGRPKKEIVPNLAQLEFDENEEKEIPPNLAEVSGKKTREVAAKQAGFGGHSTYQNAKKVVEKGSPQLIEAMDKGQASISSAADISTLPKEKQNEIVAKGEKEILAVAKEIRTQKAKKNQEKRKDLKEKSLAITPPSGKYRCIVIDPPWEMQKVPRDVRPNQVGFDYPTMNEDELKAFPVSEMAHNECHLFMWTTHKHLPMAFRLMESWGFKYIFTMVWHKPGGFQPIGLAQYNCEFVLFGRIGSLDFLDTKDFPACFNAPRREHSRKPDEFYELIKRVSPEPRIDVFSREKRDGFDQYGNEIDKFVEVSDECLYG